MGQLHCLVFSAPSTSALGSVVSRCVLPDTSVNLCSWLERVRAQTLEGYDPSTSPGHLELVVVLDALNVTPFPDPTPNHLRVLTPALPWPRKDPW